MLANLKQTEMIRRDDNRCRHFAGQRSPAKFRQRGYGQFMISAEMAAIIQFYEEKLVGVRRFELPASASRIQILDVN